MPQDEHSRQYGKFLFELAGYIAKSCSFPRGLVSFHAVIECLVVIVQMEGTEHSIQFVDLIPFEYAEEEPIIHRIVVVHRKFPDLLLYFPSVIIANRIRWMDGSGQDVQQACRWGDQFRFQAGDLEISQQEFTIRMSIEVIGDFRECARRYFVIRVEIEYDIPARHVECLVHGVGLTFVGFGNPREVFVVSEYV